MAAPYHHGNLREELLRQGVALAREKGEAGVVVREAARNAGVSQTTTPASPFSRASATPCRRSSSRRFPW